MEAISDEARTARYVAACLRWHTPLDQIDVSTDGAITIDGKPHKEDELFRFLVLCVLAGRLSNADGRIAQIVDDVRAHGVEKAKLNTLMGWANLVHVSGYLWHRAVQRQLFD